MKVSTIASLPSSRCRASRRRHAHQAPSIDQPASSRPRGHAGRTARRRGHWHRDRAGRPCPPGRRPRSVAGCSALLSLASCWASRTFCCSCARRHSASERAIQCSPLVASHVRRTCGHRISSGSLTATRMRGFSASESLREQESVNGPGVMTTWHPRNRRYQRSS